MEEVGADNPMKRVMKIGKVELISEGYQEKVSDREECVGIV